MKTLTTIKFSKHSSRNLSSVRVTRISWNRSCSKLQDKKRSSKMAVLINKHSWRKKLMNKSENTFKVTPIWHVSLINACYSMFLKQQKLISNAPPNWGKNSDAVRTDAKTFLKAFWIIPRHFSRSFTNYCLHLDQEYVTAQPRRTQKHYWNLRELLLL